jgi:NAD(P)-dependent dehydrogenase (short-subunit alcohol dehydrogenase family)
MGLVIAEHLAAQGRNVCLHYHTSQQEAASQAARIRAQYGVRCAIVGADLAVAEQASSLLERACAELGEEIPQVVNNASSFVYDDLVTLQPHQLEAQLRANTIAPLLIARSLAARKPTDGCIVNILDQKIYNLNPDFFSYTLSKQALAAATLLLARAIAPIRVCGIAPGITLPSGDQSEDEFLATHQCTPLGRSSTPQDIAQTVAYLLGCTAVTGEIIVVDGGQHLLPLPRDVMFVNRALKA